MTPEQREETKLSACPFCNGAMEPFGPSQHNHPRNDCWLSSVKIEAHEYESWNRRAQVEALTVPQWQPIETAPEDCILLLATEFFHKGDWRIKVGGYWNGGWDIFGASWTPSHWMAIPNPPAPTIPAIPGTKEGA